MRPADITGSFETAEAAVRIGQGIENGGDFSGSLEDARNKAFSRLGMVLTLMKQVFSALRKGEVNVQAFPLSPVRGLGMKEAKQPFWEAIAFTAMRKAMKLSAAERASEYRKSIWC